MEFFCVFFAAHKKLDINYEFRNYADMIKNFRDKEAAKVFALEGSRKLPADIQQRAYMKLALLNAASRIEVMKVPPSNHLEKLKGARSDEWSIRINAQWRIVFKYNLDEQNFYDVAIEDYH